MKELVLFLQSFSMGLLAPILSLVLINKGVNLSNLAWVIGIYSLTVVIFELPTGIFADFAGRKKSFLISQFFFIGAITLIFIGSIIIVSLGTILFGLGRALSSGTLDALYIDEKSANQSMNKTVSLINLLSGIGLATGAILGGMLTSISSNYLTGSDLYDFVLIIRLSLSIIIILLTIFFIKENHVIKEKTSHSLLDHFSEGIAFLSGKSIISVL